jgi:hypothetical protein
MKSMLIAAAAVGATIAGLALYFQRKNRPSNRVLDSAKDAYQTINSGIGALERPAHHAMG